MNPCADRLVVAGLLVFLSAELTGCDRHAKTAPVKGKVTYNGKPIPRGTVLFVPLTPGPTATGRINPDGTYALTTFKNGDGAVLGKHKVVVDAKEELPRTFPQGADPPTPPPIVPDKYLSHATTDLEAEVQDGENHLDFDLKGALYKPRQGRPDKTEVPFRERAK